MRLRKVKYTRLTVLIIVFIGIQLCISIKYCYRGLIQIWSKIENGQTHHIDKFGQVIRGFPLPTPERIYSGSFQDKFEIALQKNFILPETFCVPTYRHLTMNFTDVSLSLLSESSNLRPIWTKYSLLKTTEGNRICRQPTLYHATDKSNLLNRASYYNNLHLSWSGIDFYIIPTPTSADWCVAKGVYGDNVKQYFVGDKYLQGFSTLLDTAISYTWAFRDISFNEGISCFYKTDHHWFFTGAYKVYCQFWQLIYQRNNQVGLCKTPKEWFEVPGVKFYGSHAHKSGYYDKIYDVLIDGNFEMPEFIIEINGQTEKARNEKKQYLAGEFSRAKFYNHYSHYFGADQGLIKYTSNNNQGGNILVISDSYDNCIEPLIASHFVHSYFVDLRCYKHDLGEEFNIDKFLSEHHITDVLFIGNQNWILGLVELEPYIFEE